MRWNVLLPIIGILPYGIENLQRKCSLTSQTRFKSPDDAATQPNNPLLIFNYLVFVFEEENFHTVKFSEDTRIDTVNPRYEPS